VSRRLPPHVAPGVPLGLFEERIAAALGWSLRDVRSMSLHSLRELVRPVSAKLADELTERIRSGRVIIDKK
jgi:hypothetical protein